MRVLRSKRKLEWITIPAKQRGMLLLGILVFLSIATLTIGNASQSWMDSRQRETEDELIFIGQQYIKAIESYYLRTPGVIKQFPSRLEDLVQDPRFPQPVRHIRKLWHDPLAPNQDWGLIKRGTAIVGIYSQAEGHPFRTANFDPSLPVTFGLAETYQNWEFAVGVGVLAAVPASAPSSGIGSFK